MQLKTLSIKTNTFIGVNMTIKKKECGDCSLCCKLPEINYFKKKKESFKWCDDCNVGVGCKIYNERPKGCRDFYCLYHGGLTNLKPNKVGFYITVEQKEQFRDKVFVIYAETHKVHNIHKHLKEHDFFDDDGGLWKYVIRYNKNEDDLAVFDKARFGNQLKFCKRGEI